MSQEKKKKIEEKKITVLQNNQFNGQRQDVHGALRKTRREILNNKLFWNWKNAEILKWKEWSSKL